MRKNVLNYILFLVCMPVASLLARDNTPIETFIRQVKESNSFVTVSNIWQEDKTSDKTELLKFVKAATTLTIDYSNVAALLKQNHTSISLVIPRGNGSTYTIELAQYRFLSNDFQVHAVGKTDVMTNYTPGLYYSGIVYGVPGSIAAFSFFNNEVYGIFSIPGEGNYVLVPNTLKGEYYNYNQNYVLYNDANILNKENAPRCATDMLPLNYLDSKAKTSTTLNNKAYSTCAHPRVFQVADYATYTKKGSSTTNVTNYLTAVFNNLTTLYRNEGIPTLLSYVEIHTATDPYQTITPLTSDRFLMKFGYITQNTLHGCDLAMLISTHTGSMGGVAWLRTACSGYYAPDTAGPYAFCNVNNSSTTSSTAFPTYSWDVEVCTHEMGHIVGSPHTHHCCWNPPARNTAIDGCYTIEGSCADPGNPAGGGTIMSYCHLTSVGINFSLGFGQQPGDNIRRFMSPLPCGGVYTPTLTLPKGNTSISANKECTNIATGTTYYWKDNNTADQSDDTLVLAIKKNGNDIGNLNTSGFSVYATTMVGYGSGVGIPVLFPSAKSLPAPNYAMQRYWKVNTTMVPTSNVEVIFPFLATDSADIAGSSSGHLLTSYRMYKTDSTVNPDPVTDSFKYATAANVHIYLNDAVASTSRWSLTSDAYGYYAHMLMTKLSGGGTGFYGSAPNGVENVTSAGKGIYIYPNPTSDKWSVFVEDNIEPLSFRLYSIDGKLVHTQMLQSGKTNTVDPSGLPEGFYLYRITGSSNAYTGSLVKR